MPPTSRTMVGRAVATIVWSSAASSIPSASPEKITRTWRFVYVSGGSSAIHRGRIHHRVRVFEDVGDLAVAALHEEEVVVLVAAVGIGDGVVPLDLDDHEVGIEGGDEALDLVVDAGEDLLHPVEGLGHAVDARHHRSVGVVVRGLEDDVVGEAGQPGVPVTAVLGGPHAAVEVEVGLPPGLVVGHACQYATHGPAVRGSV